MGKSPKHPDWLQGLGPRQYDSYTPQRTGEESSRLIGQPSGPTGRESSTLNKAELYSARKAPVSTLGSQVYAEFKAIQLQSYEYSLKFFLDTKLNLLLIAFPFAVISKASGWNDGVTFTFSMLALCPLAERLGFVTEQLAQYTNDTLGGLLNATFGNATEVIICGFALHKGYVRVVQLSLLGSVVSNLLLVMGSAFLAGGINRPTQRFNVQGANVNSALLLLGTVAVLLPSLLSETGSEVKEDVSELALSRFESLFLLVLYCCYLLFQLVTHRFLFEEGDEEEAKPVDSEGMGDADGMNGGTVLPDMEAGGARGGLLASEDSTVSPLPGGVTGATVLQRNTSGRQTTSLELVSRPGNSRSSSGRPVDGSSSRGNTANNHNVGEVVGVEDRQLREELVAPSIGQGAKSTASDKEKPDGDDDEDELVLSKTGCFLWLTGVTLLISLLSEWIVDGIKGASKTLHIPMPFLVTILLPIVGNAAEHASAIVFAYKNRIEIALGVALGSSTQVAVLIVPFCVVLAWMMQQPLDLNFNSFEASVYFVSVLIAIITVQDGTANWLKGTLLLVTYALVAAGFWWHKDPDLVLEDVDGA